jgi:ABC-type transport system involved in cytochrome bd biosynthesis fused ATPase/permease subunit
MSNEADLLGQLLVRQHAVDEATLQAALDEQALSGDLIGVALRRRGVAAYVIDNALWHQSEARSRRMSQLQLMQAVALIAATLEQAAVRKSSVASSVLLGLLSGILSFPALFYFFSGWAWSMLGLTRSPADVAKVSLVLGGLVLLGQLLDYLSAAHVASIVSDIRHNLTVALHRRVRSAPVQRNHGQAVHEVMPALSQSLEQFTKHLEVLMVRGPRAIGTLLVFFLIFVGDGAATSTFILGFAALSFALPAFVGRKSDKHLSEEARLLSRALQHIEPFYTRFRTSLNRFEQTATQLSRHLVQHHQNQYSKWMVWSWVYNVGLTLNSLALALVIVFGGWRVVTGSMALADYFILTLAITLILPRLSELSEIHRSTKAAGQYGTAITNELKNFHFAAPPYIDDRPLRLSVQSAGLQTHESKILVALRHDFLPGRLSFIVGPSGCGKSTLTRLLAGTGSDASVQAEIVYESGQRACATLGQVALLGQEHRFLNTDNLLSAILNRDSHDAADQQRVNALLVRMGVDICPSRGRSGSNQWHAYSKGELQRVHLLRGLMSRRRIKIFDEPTASLDAGSAQIVRAMLEDVPPDEIRLVVTHDVDWALSNEACLDLARHVLTE